MFDLDLYPVRCLLLLSTCSGKSVKSSGVVERLRTFCAEPDLEMTSRLAVLRLLKQSFHLSQEDEALLLFCNTTAIVGQFWKKTVRTGSVNMFSNAF